MVFVVFGEYLPGAREPRYRRHWVNVVAKIAEAIVVTLLWFLLLYAIPDILSGSIVSVDLIFHLDKRFEGWSATGSVSLDWVIMCAVIGAPIGYALIERIANVLRPPNGQGDV